MFRSALAGIVVLLPGCSRQVPAYPPPAQYVAAAGAGAASEVRLLRMNDPDAVYSILDGVLGPGSGDESKWTTDHARFEFRVHSLANTDLYMRYSVHSGTLKDTGPLTITISVNGRPFDSFVKSKPGDYEYRHPAGGITGDVIQIDVTVNPPYIAPADKQKLGILLSTIGFVPRR